MKKVVKNIIYPIYVFGSPELRAECKQVTKEYPDLKQLVEDMFETMYQANGVGLAAPQIGVPICMFVIDISQFAEDNPELDGFKKVFINPEIYEVTEHESAMEEGCLSVPGVHEDVERPVAIKIRYMDEEFKQHDEIWGNYAARVIQHEYDHLDGNLFVDHLAPLRKSMVRSKLVQMSKGKYEAEYRTKQ